MKNLHSTVLVFFAALAQVALGTRGVATWYEDWKTGDGSCEYPYKTVNKWSVALSTTYGKTKCGQCISVTGPNGNSIVVRVIDTCESCESTHIDLTDEIFPLLANPDIGVITVDWTFVDCSGLQTTDSSSGQQKTTKDTTQTSKTQQVKGKSDSNNQNNDKKGNDYSKQRSDYTKQNNAYKKGNDYNKQGSDYNYNNQRKENYGDNGYTTTTADYNGGYRKSKGDKGKSSGDYNNDQSGDYSNDDNGDYNNGQSADYNSGKSTTTSGGDYYSATTTLATSTYPNEYNLKQKATSAASTTRILESVFYSALFSGIIFLATIYWQ